MTVQEITITQYNSMKKKETPFLDFYKECSQSGSFKSRISPVSHLFGEGGLCSTLIGKHTIFQDYFRAGNNLDGTYWGYRGQDDPALNDECKYGFTPLRQTIILLCAAINNEL